MRRLQQHPQLLAYLIFTLVIAGLFWRQERTINSVCDSNAEVRHAMIELVEASAKPLPIPAGATPDIREALESANRRTAEVSDSANSILLPPPCQSGG